VNLLSVDPFLDVFCIHFCCVVEGLGRRRRRRHHNSDSDDDEAEEGAGADSSGHNASAAATERDSDWGRVVCVDYSDKRGSKKDLWFPALIVAPTAQQPPAKTGRDEHLVRSFRDGRYYKVSKKDAREFTKELVLSKSESNSSALRSAVEKAFTFMDKQDLPNGWDYDLLMGNVVPQVCVSTSLLKG
jgi:Ras-related protein Rab-1A